MPASSRCSGVNLYNHSKQVGKPQELSCSYVQLKDCEIWSKVDRGVLREFGYHRFKDNVWSEEMGTHYSARYRTSDQFKKIFNDLLIREGYNLVVDEALFPKQLNNRIDTRQHLFYLKKMST